MSGLKLYEYPAEIDRILAEADGGELSPDSLVALDKALGDLHAKVRSVVAAIRNLDAMADACRAEKARLTDRVRSLDNQSKSLKEYLLRCMANEEIDRVVTDIASVSRVANSRPSIRWAWDSAPPAEFTKVEVKIDGDKAYAAYRAGLLPEGFAVELSEHLRVL